VILEPGPGVGITLLGRFTQREQRLVTSHSRTPSGDVEQVVE
jgi:hypothetical protein